MQLHNPVDINIFEIISINGTDPNAGANFSLAVETNTRWQLTGLRFTLTTDANAATRLIQVHGFDGAFAFQLTASTNPQTASQVIGYTFNIGSGDSYTGGLSTEIVAPLNSALFLNLGDDIRITIIDIQVGDEITAILLRFKQWITEN